MTRQDQHTHRSAKTCHVYQKSLAGDSIKEYCHVTRKYQGAAHNACNLKLHLHQKNTTIPVVFQNQQGYDSHLLMQAFLKVEGKVSCVQNNKEKYIVNVPI